MTGRRSFGIALATLLLGLVAAGAALADGPAKEQAAHYQFRGHLKAVSSTSLSLTVEGGNHIALKKMLGASVDQSFSVGDGTEFLKWTSGTPTVVHAGDLAAGDWVVVNVRAPQASDLSEVEAKQAGVVSDRGTQPNPPSTPLFLFRGKLAAAAGSSSAAIDVTGGNRRALRLLIGQNASQTFAFGSETIFLLWQGKVPTVIAASDLKVGDRITVRIRADRGSTLAQVEATPAVHVGDHEPRAAAANG